MSNELEKLLEEIQYKTKMSLEDIALRIGYSRPYLNKQKNKGGNKAIIGHLRQEFKEILEATNDTSPPGTEEAHLKEVNKLLQKHNDALEKLLHTNLTSLSTMQMVILAEIKAGLQWEARKLAKGDPKKEMRIRGEVSKLVGENLQAFGVGDKNLEIGRLDKA
jgi:hypothetical protein